MSVEYCRLVGLEPTEALTRGLQEDGIVAPTAVQQQAIPAILAGRDAVVQSGTGTGKTLAYLLPILERLRRDPSSRAVIFAPAPELVMQTLRVAERYKDESIAVAAVIASRSRARQKAQVQKSTRLIVGTPGRLLELYAARKLKGVNIVVLDEPGPLLSGPNADFLREIVSRPEPALQLIVVGATLSPSTEALVRETLREDALRTQVADEPLHTSIEHAFVAIRPGAAKDLQVVRFIQNQRCRRTVVFTDDTRLVRHLYRYFHENGLAAESLSAERSSEERRRAVAAFASGEARVLVATDLAMRGLDIENVEWVLHYELPRTAQAYVHRAGRTGRAGRSGRSVIFVEDAERARLKGLARELGLEFFAMA